MVLRGPVPPMVPSSTAVAVPAAAARSLPAGASLDLFNLTDVSVVTDPRIAAEYDALVKIVVLGDSAVGKSAVLRRFADDIFEASYISTIGVDFKIQTMRINSKVVKLQLWDTAGQERFRAIATTYYRGAHGFMLVYDVTDPTTLDSIKRTWLPEIKRYGRDASPILLIGNKWDIDSDGAVIEAAQTFALENGLQHLVVSAKTGERVTDAFVGLTRLLLAGREAGLAGDKAKVTGSDLVPRTTSSVFDCCKTS